MAASFAMAKRRRVELDEAFPTTGQTLMSRSLPELTAYGVGPAELSADKTRRWLAYKVTEKGAEIITPRRHGVNFGESLASAAARVHQALQDVIPRLGRAS